jgi:hypothetical protein
MFYARVRVESRSNDRAFDCADDLHNRNVVPHLDFIPLCPMIAINAGLTHPQQRVWSSRS